MTLVNSQNYYEVLEVRLDATQTEIRQSYFRLKMAYSKDSVALYTLMGKEETDDIVKKIEEAYQVLSDERKKKEYDKNHVNTMEEESPFSAVQDPQVVSIDRVPPMDKLSSEEDVLVAPVTDFSHPSPIPQHPQHTNTPDKTESAPIRQSQSSETSKSNYSPALQEKIDHETEWSGSFIKTLRESKKISIEELSDFTKISKTYLIAIENEDYKKLPAATFVRGFVTQVAKRLKLPSEKVASAYVNRYRQTCPGKA